MISNEQKKLYIDLINKTGYPPEALKSVTNFINSYDGTNDADFHAAMFIIVGVFLKAGGDNKKAEAYDKLIMKLDDFENAFDKIDELIQISENAMSDQDDHHVFITRQTP